MIFEHESYQTYLKSIMSEKAARNPRFSLRAMALHLDIAPSFLCSILRREKNLSLESATKIAKKLALNEHETEYFFLLVQKESTRDPDFKETVLSRIRKMNPEKNHNDLDADRFKVISDWYHFAIMACTNLTGLTPTPKNIAGALGLNQVDVDLALDRLERLGMVEKDEKRVYRKVIRNPRFASSVPNQALRNFHRQTLQLATQSLEDQTPSEKVIGSETLTIDRDQLEQFRRLVDDFFEKALALAKKSKRKNAVYHLGVQFFDFTPNLQKKPKRKKP